MKKLILGGGLSVIALAIMLSATPVFAAGKSAPAGKSDTAHLYIFMKKMHHGL
jgi:hypothetical protein